MNVTSATSDVLPAGTYIVGDPCYTISDQDWIPLLNAAGLETEPMPQIMEGRIGNVAMTASGTEYGDGVYEDQEGREYPVDAGLIGVVPVESVAGHVYLNEPKDGTHVITFTRPFRVAYNEGTITIGHIRIETGDNDEWIETEDNDDWS